MTARDRTTTVTLRPVGPDDTAFIRRVYASSRADELAQVPWSPEQKQTFCAMQQHAQQTDYWRRYPDSEHAVVLGDDEPVGRVWINVDETELRLLDVTILPEHQGREIGTALLRQLQQRATDAGVPLHHTVLTSNQSALRLYLRVGFMVIDSTETHHLMEWVPST